MENENTNWELNQEYAKHVVGEAEKMADQETQDIKNFCTKEEYDEIRQNIIQAFLAGANCARMEIEILVKKHNKKTHLNEDTFVQRLKECQENDDTERAHYVADEILFELLTKLGFNKVVDIYEDVDKWYA